MSLIYPWLSFKSGYVSRVLRGAADLYRSLAKKWGDTVRYNLNARRYFYIIQIMRFLTPLNVTHRYETRSIEQWSFDPLVVKVRGFNAIQKQPHMTATQHITVALVIAILLVPQILALYLTNPRRRVRKSEEFV